MSTTVCKPEIGWRDDLWRCVSCGGEARESDAGRALTCTHCGQAYPIRDGILVAKESNSLNNEIARQFYDGPLWPRFRFWEWLTFVNLGGERRARNKVLGHLPQEEGLNLLDVAIGDGVYLPWLPESWSIVGLDLSKVQLNACQKHAESRDLRLVLGEAEDLPVLDNRFDTALSIGAFNYFNDPEKALREMARAVKPGGTIVVSDEVPDLTDWLPFRKLGLPGINHWIVSKMMHLGDDFTEVVERNRTLDVEAIAQRVLQDCQYQPIWRGVGYVFHGRVPES